MTRVGGDKVGTYVIAHLDDVLGGKQFDAKAFGLLYNTLGKLGAGDAFGEAGVVVQAFGDTGLSSQDTALDDQDVKAVTCGINSGCKGGGAATDDDEVIKLALCFGFKS